MHVVSIFGFGAYLVLVKGSQVGLRVHRGTDRGFGLAVCGIGDASGHGFSCVAEGLRGLNCIIPIVALGIIRSQ